MRRWANALTLGDELAYLQCVRAVQGYGEVPRGTLAPGSWMEESDRWDWGGAQRISR